MRRLADLLTVVLLIRSFRLLLMSLLLVTAVVTGNYGNFTFFLTVQFVNMCLSCPTVLDFQKELSDMFDPTKGKLLCIFLYSLQYLSASHSLHVLKTKRLKVSIFSPSCRDHDWRLIGGLDVIRR